jgi:hypothetical protein
VLEYSADSVFHSIVGTSALLAFVHSVQPPR